MPSTPSLEDHIHLAQGRWAVALLADIAAHDGARFVELLHRLELSRDSLARTLEAGTKRGWVERKPGYGHPLRPEYVLTSDGKRMAALAGRIDVARDAAGLAPGTLARWSMPIIFSVDAGHQRFNELARTLPAASPRALSQGLRKLTEQQLVTRSLIDGYPPASLYSLTGPGAILARAA